MDFGAYAHTVPSSHPVTLSRRFPQGTFIIIEYLSGKTKLSSSAVPRNGVCLSD